MSVNQDSISEVISTLLSLLKYPMARQDILGLMGSEIIRETFPGCTADECDAYLFPGTLEESIIYNEAQHTFAMRDERQCEALAREAIRRQPKLPGVVASRVPWQSRPDASESLLRDIRNYFYANDANGVRQRLELYCRISQEDFLKGRPFEFLLCQLDVDWYSRLDPKLLSLTSEYLLPLAASRLADSSGFEDFLLRKVDILSESALLSLVDNSLLRGNLPEARRLMASCKSPYAIELREAWILFLEGKNAEAVSAFEGLLAKMRKATGRSDIYFQSICGIFMIFALIRDGSEEALRHAQDYTLLGTKVPYIGNAYLTLQAYLQRRLGRKSASDSDYALDAYENDLSRFFQLVCGVWEIGSEAMGNIAAELQARTEYSYPWISRECARMSSSCQMTFDGAEESDDSDAGKGSIFQCVSLPPKWSRMLSNITGMLRSADPDVNFRLCWFCSYDSQWESPVRLRPVEQRTSKNGGWSKGRSLLIAKMSETRSWPDYFTLQDQQICSLIWEERQRTKEVEKHGGAFASVNAVEAAIGHPLLFWDMPQPQPFQCRKARPILKISEEDARIQFAVSPMPPSDDTSVTVLRDEASDLNVYSFSKRHLALAGAMRNGFAVPANQSALLASFISLAGQEMTLLSDAPLDFVQLPPHPTERRIHFRLQPHDSRMTVDMFILPFPPLMEPFKPGMGPRECICQENGRLVRYVRDFNRELDEMKSIMELCDCLDETTRQDGFSWELVSLEQCYLFILSLQDFLDRVTVHWPENHRLKVQRRVTIEDVSISCKSTSNWFYSLDGEVHLDDGLVISFRELLVAARKEHGNFIRLDDGQIVALADAFRKRLDDIASVTVAKDDEVFFNRYAIPYLELMTGDIAGSQTSLKPFAERISAAMQLQPELAKGLNATLRPYQMDGFVWLSRLDAWGAGACLADDMGLGKTIQSIALILSKASEGPCLVVAPTSVCSNWLQEFQKFAPTLRLIAFGGNHRNELFSGLGAGCVMVTSYGLLQSEEATFCKVNWRVAILDEAQAIKNHNAKRSRAVVGLNAQFRVVTTGTPVENNLGELWSIFNYINPGLLGSYDEFQARFAIPIERNHSGETLERLSKIVHPFILRRIKSQVLTDLPPKTEIQLQIELSNEEKAFYEALRQQLLDEIKGLRAGSSAMCIQVIAAIVKLRQAACNPKLINEKVSIQSSKLQAFSELLDDLIAGGHKVLVFSQFVKHLALVRPVLEERGIPYQYLDGNTPVEERKAAVDSFQNGNGDVFLISLRAGGFGLNLTAADYVIHLDPWWNPAVEDQASDRAHRIGQSKPVTIYRLIAKNTIEDKILQLHYDKRDLAESILSGTDSVNKLSQDELLRLLTMAGLE